MAGLWELPAIGVLHVYCLGVGWSQWGPLDVPGTHLSMQHDAVVKIWVITVLFIHVGVTH